MPQLLIAAIMPQAAPLQASISPPSAYTIRRRLSFAEGFARYMMALGDSRLRAATLRFEP
jgi:hypothetical protein